MNYHIYKIQLQYVKLKYEIIHQKTLIFKNEKQKYLLPDHFTCANFLYPLKY